MIGFAEDIPPGCCMEKGAEARGSVRRLLCHPGKVGGGLARDRMGKRDQSRGVFGK